jgi:hypothetical protein
MHTLSAPTIEATYEGTVFTVSLLVTTQPDAAVNVQINTPTLTGVMTPVVAPMVATDRGEQDQVPLVPVLPPVESVIVEPVQTDVGPLITGGAAIVMVSLRVQPNEFPQTIISVPADTPVTIPAVLTVATVVLVLVHVVAPDEKRVSLEPTQREVKPEKAPGRACT